MPKTAAKRGPAKPQKSLLPEMRCFLACDYAGRVAAEGGEKTTLSGVFNMVWANQLPAMYQFYLFIQLHGGKLKSKIKITATYANGQKIVELGSDVIPFEPGETREIMAKVPLLPIEHPGDIQFIVSINDRKIGWPLTLSVSKNVTAKA